MSIKQSSIPIPICDKDFVVFLDSYNIVRGREKFQYMYHIQPVYLCTGVPCDLYAPGTRWFQQDAQHFTFRPSNGRPTQPFRHAAGA